MDSNRKNSPDMVFVNELCQAIDYSPDVGLSSNKTGKSSKVPNWLSSSENQWGSIPPWQIQLLSALQEEMPPPSMMQSEIESQSPPQLSIPSPPYKTEFNIILDEFLQRELPILPPLPMEILQQPPIPEDFLQAPEVSICLDALLQPDISSNASSLPVEMPDLYEAIPDEILQSPEFNICLDGLLQQDFSIPSPAPVEIPQQPPVPDEILVEADQMEVSPAPLPILESRKRRIEIHEDQTFNFPPAKYQKIEGQNRVKELQEELGDLLNFNPNPNLVRQAAAAQATRCFKKRVIILTKIPKEEVLQQSIKCKESIKEGTIIKIQQSIRAVPHVKQIKNCPDLDDLMPSISDLEIDLNISAFLQEKHLPTTAPQLFPNMMDMKDKLQLKLQGEPTNFQLKGRRMRTHFTDIQLNELEKQYEHNKFISIKHRCYLAENLELPEETIKNWFQNRRQREKRGPSKRSH